jgi:hypothetical protein
MAKQGPFGARVYLMDNKTILVYQTLKRGTAQNAPYVVYPKEQQGAFVDVEDDKSIAGAIRSALTGKLR